MGQHLAQSLDPPNPLPSLCSVSPESLDDSINTNNRTRGNRGLVTSPKLSSKLTTDVGLPLRFPESESSAFSTNQAISSGLFLHVQCISLQPYLPLKLELI